MPSLTNNELTLTIKAVDQASTILKRVQTELDGTTKEANKGSGAMEKLRNNWAPITAVAAASSTSFVMLGGAIVKSVGDYQQGMSVFQQVSGATAEQMALVQRNAIALGNDIRLPGVSAKTAADAMIELSKAGLSVNDTLAASKGVLALAKAGQLETAEAAGISANALLAFNLRGSEASRVADLLAAAANASSSDVRGMGQSMAQVSAVAAQTKRPIEDVVAQIALLANQGIKGSDAGTSLKTMLMALTPKSKEASEAMESLGLNAYDAAGRMKSTRDIIAMYSEKLSTMTDEQRDQTLQTIFGSDAMRAASILIRGGTDAYDKMAASVTKAGAAQKNAAAFTTGLKGNIEGITSSMETIALTIGMKLLPFLESASSAIAKWISQNEQLATAIAVGVVAFLGFGAVIGSIAAVLALVGSAAALIFVGIAAGAGAAVAALTVYWEPISVFFQRLWADVQATFDTFVGWVKDGFGKTADSATWLKGEFEKAFDKIEDAVKDARDWFIKYEDTIKGVATTLGVIFGPALIKAGITALVTGVKIAASGIVAGAGWVTGALVASGAWVANTVRMALLSAGLRIMMVGDAVLSAAGWVKGAVISSAAWLLHTGQMIASSSVAAVKIALHAADAGWAWVFNGTRVAVVWVTEMAKVAGAALLTAGRAVAHAAVAGAAWVLQATRSSVAWVVTELPKIVAAFVVTSAAAVIEATKSSVAWIASAARTSVAWVITELPKIVLAFLVTSGSAITHAAVSSGAWIAAATASAVAWVVTELPRIIAAFALASGASIIHAAIAAVAWVTSAATASSAVMALGALIATPLVMPAIVIGAALAALGIVIAKANETIGVIKSVGDALETSRRSGAETDAAIKKLHDEGKISNDKLQTYLKNTAAAAEKSKADMYTGFFGPLEKALDNITVRISGTQEKYKGSGFGGFATGTNFAPGGTTWVGERGPELVNLPRGSKVFTNSQSRQMAGGQGRGGDINVTNNNYTQLDYDRGIAELGFKLRAA